MELRSYLESLELGVALIACSSGARFVVEGLSLLVLLALGLVDVLVGIWVPFVVELISTFSSGAFHGSEAFLADSLDVGDEG